MTAANVLTIPADVAFAETLARGVVEKADRADDPLALARITILLPTRRAVRTLGEAFARVLGGAALLPQIRPLGDVDEDELLFDPSTDDMSLPPAIEPIRRRLLLASLVQNWDHAKHGRSGGMQFAQAASLARGLARFLDEAETQGADFEKLDSLAPSGLAEHWSQVRDFLAFIREEWPKLLAAEGSIDPAERRNLALAALARSYRERPPSLPIIAAGSTGSIPATAALLSTIARLSAGAVVLPGLDRILDEQSWTALDAGHPQYGMKQLLGRIGIQRDEVRDWTESGRPARLALLRETLRPAPTTDAWRAIADRGGDDIENGLKGISLVEAAHPTEEATAIALVLREVLETPGRTAALVTPDRNLARRVAAELGRWNIVIDDSAGRPLAHTPPGTFLMLLAEAADEAFAPVPLLALLKHPLAAGGMAPADLRRRVRELDRLVLRGPRPDPGLDGILKAIEKLRVESDDTHRFPLASALALWLTQLSGLLRPFAQAMANAELPLEKIVVLHAETAELLSATSDEAGAARLWCGEAGEVAAELMAALTRAAPSLPPIGPGTYPALFRVLTEERAVRPVYGSHPRLAILGPLEARLQQFDVLVLGGLNEGSWPQSAAADPWLSRPMRQALGLESPERRIGQAAHDFATLAAAPRVILTRALKSEGTPTVASRWLERLRQLTKGLGLEVQVDSESPYGAIASASDLPDGAPRPEPRPAPRPPVRLRPRSLSVTEIETWLRDPYAIYARHILRLRPLDPLDAEIGALERGSAIHLALERFLKLCPDEMPPDAMARLVAIADDVFREEGVPKAALALWRPRFFRAAEWFIRIERERRTDIVRSHVEISGQRVFPGRVGDFVLRGRADRIDILTDGSAAIVDYKTGQAPSNSQVETLFAPQLPLEAAILAEGGFENIGKLATSDLIYIRLSGGTVPGELRHVKGDLFDLTRRVEVSLIERIAKFDDKDTPYVPRIAPIRAAGSGDYDHLARVREWSLSGWKEDAE